ncbi:FAD-binding oxidoreductase [Amycolatopsis sp. CA-128772]|uniref:NAD(P)/FAD-dependent oxidoreductase n=1 Tax=Amycolatopsis sp. CA-128772 TaxID=2073159 RepID=UPI001E54A108|nr:FAD-dependent oxidoreductase [Amycolatopsis sp. CA-128772]
MSTTCTTFTGWVDSPTDLRPPLTEDTTCSVAVIGGGLAGLATALRLAEHGVDAVLLESAFCGHGSGSRNAGQLASAPGGDIQLLNLLHRKRMPAIIRLTENAAAHVEGLIEALGTDCDYEATGNVFAAVSRGQLGRRVVSRRSSAVPGPTSRRARPANWASRTASSAACARSAAES